VTLVELLIALAIASVLILGVLAAFQTTQRSAAIGEAREHIYQNARVALDLMAKEIKNAYIDNRNRELVFVSADGLAGLANSILEFKPNPPTTPPTAIVTWGLGNAQTVHGIYTTRFSAVAPDLTSFEFYADPTSGTYSVASIKAVNDLYTISPGPPDRLDFTCLTSNFPGNTTNESRLAEVRYMVTTETFVDNLDNDEDRWTDADDDIPPDLPPDDGLNGLGDMIKMDPRRREHFNPNTGKILDLALFHLRRGIGLWRANPSDPWQVRIDKNPFSMFDMATGDGTYPDPQGRYPSRNFDDWSSANGGENIGSYIYDLQFEFYGKIAIALAASGANEGKPEVWGVGWGYQDVRGEDVGTDGNGPEALSSGTVSVQQGNTVVDGTGASGWPTTNDALINGIFFVWPGGTEFDVSDPNNDVYTIVDSTSTSLTLNRPYAGEGDPTASYRIIEPTQADGKLQYGEDLGSDGLVNDPLDSLELLAASGIPNNVSDNDGNDSEPSIGEGNARLDSRVMGIWDSRSPDPRNPRRAAELDGDDTGFTTSGGDDDRDGYSGGSDDAAADAAGSPEQDDAFTDATPTYGYDESNDLIDDDGDGIADDRFYEPAGKPDGMDDPMEADPTDDSLPKAVRITIAIRDPQQTLEPVVLSTVVWLSTAR